MNPLLQRISVDPNVCFGKLCIPGTEYGYFGSLIFYPIG